MSKLFSGVDTFTQYTYNIDQLATGIFICGQSNGQGSTPVTSPNDPIYHGQNLQYWDGGIIDQKENLNQSVASSMTNLLISRFRDGGDDQPVLMTENHAVGGRGYDEIKKGGTEPNAYAKFVSDLTAIHAEKPVVVKAFNLVHGEADLTNPWIQYRDNLIQFLMDYNSDCKLITEQTYDPIMIVSQIASQKFYIPSLVNNIKSPLALLDVCRVSSSHFSCGPQYWCETNGGLDQYHLNTRDQVISGEYRADVYQQVVIDNDRITPTATIPISATLGSDFIDVKFEMNKPPLTWDNEYMPAIADNGFVYSDDSGRTIAGVEILPDGITVRVSLSGSVGTNPDLQYAWHNGEVATGVVTNGPRGTLCDSNSRVSVYYPAYKMRRYALAFRYAAGYLEFS